MCKKRILLSTILSTLLLLQGCGSGEGGNTSSGDTNIAAMGTIVVPKTAEGRQSLYDTKIETYSAQIKKSRQLLDKMLISVSNDFQKIPDTSNMSMSEIDAMYDQINGALPEYAKLLLISNELATLEANMNKDIKSATIRQLHPRFYSILISGVVLGVSGLFAWAIHAHNERKIIATKAIAKATPKQLTRYNKALGLNESSSKKETLQYFNALGFRDSEQKVTKLKGCFLVDIAEGGDTDTSEKLKAQAVKTIKEAGHIAVTSVVGELLNVTGGQGVDKILSGAAKMLGTSSEDAALIGAVGDLVVSAKGKQPLDFLTNHLTIIQQSKDAYDETIAETKQSLSKAMDYIQKIAKNQLPDDVSIDDLSDAATALMRNIVLHTGQGKENPDGSIAVKVPYRTAITTATNVKNGDTIPIPETDDSDLLIVGDGKVPEVLKDQTISGQTTIKIDAEDIKTTESMTLSATVVSSDDQSVIYRVTAKLLGITKQTTISLDVGNAATSGATKTLDKDGSVSWNVTVLDKDATLSITRSDTGVSESLTLKGTGNTPVDIYDAFAIVDYDYTCHYYDEHGKLFASDESNDSEVLGVMGTSPHSFVPELYSVEGSLSNSTINMTVMINDAETLHFTGNLSSGTISGGDNDYFGGSESCSGHYNGHFATTSELQTFVNECASDQECRNSDYYQVLITNLDYH